MNDLSAIQNKPEGRQLYSRILRYMLSDKFNPAQSLTQAELVALFSTKVSTKRITGVNKISYQ